MHPVERMSKASRTVIYITTAVSIPACFVIAVMLTKWATSNTATTGSTKVVVSADPVALAELQTARRGDFIIIDGHRPFKVVVHSENSLEIDEGSISAPRPWNVAHLASQPGARLVKFGTCEWVFVAAQTNGVAPERVNDSNFNCPP